MVKITQSFHNLILILVISLILSGCNTTALNINGTLSRADLYFDTLVTITLYDTQDEAILNHCFDICEYYENLFSISVVSSDVCTINNSSCNSIIVSSDTIALLISANKYYELSKGSFDISIGSLSTLWTEARANKELPPELSINECMKHVGMENIEFLTSDNTVSKNDAAAKIDFGGLAKGYIADRIRDYLISENVNSAIINLGGNIIVLGTKPGNELMNIGVKRPFGKEGEVMYGLSLKNKSIVTSGIYERYFEKDGRIYHHILDKNTGYPADTDLMSATIITESSLDADALSTICILLGSEKALDFINSLDDTEAVLITSNYEILTSEGATEYLINN